MTQTRLHSGVAYRQRCAIPELLEKERRKIKSQKKWQRIKADPIRLEKYREKDRRNKAKRYQNDPLLKKKLNEKQKAYYRTIGGKFLFYRRWSRIRNIEFDLTKDEMNVLWQKPCSYCGNEIETIGIDRIDSENGYKKENITSCCSRCNRMKSATTKEDFLNHCHNIVKHNNL
jgi:hypothetical protein